MAYRDNSGKWHRGSRNKSASSPISSKSKIIPSYANRGLKLGEGLTEKGEKMLEENKRSNSSNGSSSGGSSSKSNPLQVVEPSKTGTQLDERTLRVKSFKESTKNYANAGELLKDYALITRKTSTGATAGLIPKQTTTKTNNSTQNTYNVLPYREQVMEGLTVKKTAASEKYFASIVTSKSSIPGNTVYSNNGKIVGILDKKNNELIFTKGFNNIQEPQKEKGFFGKVWEGGSSAMLTTEISKAVNVVDDKYFGDKLRTLDYKESKGLWSNKNKNPLLFPSKKYDDFKAKNNGKGNIPLNFMQGFTDSISKDPLGNAAILAGSAGVGAVAGVSAKVVGATPIAKSLSAAAKYNTFTRTMTKGVGLGVKTVIGTAVTTSVSMDILTNKNPSYRAGEIGKEFLFIGQGLKEGYKTGQKIPGQIKSAVLNYKYKNKLSTNLPATTTKAGKLTTQNKALSNDIKVEVQEIKSINFGEYKNAEKGIKYTYTEKGLSEWMNLKDIPRGNAIKVTGTISKNTRIKVNSPQDLIYGKPTKNVMLRKDQDAYFTFTQNKPINTIISNKDFSKINKNSCKRA